MGKTSRERLDLFWTSCTRNLRQLLCCAQLLLISAAICFGMVTPVTVQNRRACVLETGSSAAGTITIFQFMPPADGLATASCCTSSFHPCSEPCLSNHATQSVLHIAPVHISAN